MEGKILIVGGAGYIGSHMELMLKDKGIKTIIFDNLSRGFRVSIPNAELYVGDLLNKDDIDNCLKSNNIKFVIHFAAFAYVGESVKNPSIYYENNVMGTINLLNSMKRNNVKNIVFSSSCATYGVPEKLPITEIDIQEPINPYGKTKLMVENILLDYANAYNFNSISLRYFNAAGCDSQNRAGERHEPETHLIPLVLEEAMRIKLGGDPEKTKLLIFGDDHNTYDGSCVRDYVHVEDLCDAHLKALYRLKSMSMSNGKAEFYNLANGNGFSVFEVIEAARNITQQPIQYTVMAKRDGDPSALIGSSKKAKEYLKWEPKYKTLDSIIATAWEWMLLNKSK